MFVLLSPPLSVTVFFWEGVGATLAVLGAYSLLCAQESLLLWLRNPNGVSRIGLSQLYARQKC